MKVTVCDFCRKPTDSIHISSVGGRVVIKAIEDNRWKTKDVCITCLFNMLQKEIKKIKSEVKNGKS